MQDLLEYFIETTNERLINIEKKLDQLMALKAQMLILGVVASTVASGLVSVAFNWIVKR